MIQVVHIKQNQAEFTATELQSNNSKRSAPSQAFSNILRGNLSGNEANEFLTLLNSTQPQQMGNQDLYAADRAVQGRQSTHEEGDSRQEYERALGHDRDRISSAPDNSYMTHAEGQRASNQENFARHDRGAEQKNAHSDDTRATTRQGADERNQSAERLHAKKSNDTPAETKIPHELTKNSRNERARNSNFSVVSRELRERIHELISFTNAKTASGASREDGVRVLDKRTSRQGRENDSSIDALKQTLRDLNSFLERISTERERIATNGATGKALTDLHGSLQRLNGSMEKTRPDSSNTITTSELRELSTKIANLTNTVRQEGSSKPGDDGMQQQNHLSFSMQRADGTQRRSVIPGLTPRGHQFQTDLQQMIDRARISVRDSGNASLSMKLHPEELGSLNMRLGLDQGVLSGRFTVHTEDARHLLMENLEYIKQELENAGITVGEFQVNVRGEGEGLPREETSSAEPINQQDRTADKAAGYDTTAMLLHGGEINVII